MTIKQFERICQKRYNVDLNIDYCTVSYLRTVIFNTHTYIKSDTELLKARLDLLVRIDNLLGIDNMVGDSLL